ncbi:MAG TPA: hypothetical protein V6C65_29935 [Allocoleopsis sp.]
MLQGKALFVLLLISSVGVSLANCSRPSAIDRPISSNPTVAPASPAPSARTDFVILPGVRVGIVTTATTFPDLVAQFGVDNLTNQAYNVGEGERVPATRVNLGETESFTILWQDENRTQAVAVTELGTAWKTPEGIGIGMSLQQLEAKLGEFQLYGFGWDYSGTVLLQDTNLADYQGLLILRLSPDRTTAETQPQLYQSVSGDTPFSSNNPAMQALNPTINRIIVKLSPAPQTP